MPEKIRLDGLTLTVEDVTRSLAFYTGKLGLETAWNAAPAFGMVRHGAATIGLLAFAEAEKEGVTLMTQAQQRGIHVYAVELAQGRRGKK